MRPPLFPLYPAGSLEPHLASRLDHHEAITEAHAFHLDILSDLPDRVSKLEAAPRSSIASSIPWAKLGFLALLWGLAAIGLISPEAAVKLATGAP